MASVEKFLDKNARNRELRAFAYLQSLYATGAHSALDCLLPFIVYAVSQNANNQFVPNEVISFVRDNYKMRIPYYMIEDMVPKLCEIGVLEHDKLTEIYLCRDVSKKDKPSLAEVDLTEEQIDALEIKLADFAAQKGIERPLSVQSWAMGLQDGSD